MKQVLAELIERARDVATHDDGLRPRARALGRPRRACGASRSRTWSTRSSPTSCARRSCSAVLSALLGPSGVRLHGSKLNLKAPAIRLAGGVAPGLGVLSPHQRRPAGRRRAARRRHRRERSAARAARQPPRADLRSPRSRRLLLRRDRSGARSTSTSALPRRSTAPAGSCSFHHVRAVHGSAQNRSAHSRNLLLYEFAAADAFPLLGVADWDDFNRRLLVGDADGRAAHRGVPDPHAAAAGEEPGLDLREPDGARAPLLRRSRRARRAPSSHEPNRRQDDEDAFACACTTAALLRGATAQAQTTLTFGGSDAHRLDPRPAERALHRLRQRQGRRQAEGQLHPGRAARQRRAGDRADDAGLGAHLRRRARLVRQLGQGLRDPRLGLHLPRRRPHAEVPRQPDLCRDGREAAQGAGPAHPGRGADAAAHPVLEEADRRAGRPERREDARARDQDLPHAVGDARHAAVARWPGARSTSA